MLIFIILFYRLFLPLRNDLLRPSIILFALVNAKITGTSETEKACIFVYCLFSIKPIAAPKKPDLQHQITLILSIAAFCGVEAGKIGFYTKFGKIKLVEPCPSRLILTSTGLFCPEQMPKIFRIAYSSHSKTKQTRCFGKNRMNSSRIDIDLPI